MMDLLVVGLSHRTAPIAVRERLAFSGEGLEVALTRLRRLPGLDEAVLLSTCNRTEVYGVSPRPEVAAAEIAEWMGERSAGSLGESLYEKLRVDALSHLFQVASSLDSMVLGEPQILGQVKEAFAAAKRQRAAGVRIERYFSRAFRLAKKVRTETAVGEQAVSMSFVAVQLARQVFGDLHGRTVLLVGAGKMCELAAEHLRKAGVARVIVANRSLPRARELARRWNAEAVPLSSVGEHLEAADIVLASTSAPGYVIGRGAMAAAVKARRYRPVLLVDLALPRDVDPAVNELANVYAYDIDDLQHVVDESLTQRKSEAERGLVLVRREVDTFVRDEAAQGVLPVLATLRHTADRIVEGEIEKTLARAGFTGDQAERVRAMARAVVKKLLHAPTLTLKGAAASEEGERLAAALVSLFALDVDGTVSAIAEQKARRRAEREEEGDNVVPLDRGQDKNG